MTMPALPPNGNTNWRGWASAIHDAATEVTSGRLTDDALGAVLVTSTPSSNDVTVGAVPAQIVTGNKRFQGLMVFGNNTGLAANPRQPFQTNQVVDGSTFTAGMYGSDVVGHVNAVTFKGGFTAEVGFDTANPHDVVGANDYILSGSTAGDLAGITSFYGRIVEAHVNAPDAALGTLSALTLQSSVNASSGSVSNMHTLYIHAPDVHAGAVTNAYNLYLQDPGTGAADNRWALYSAGKAQFAGQALFTGSRTNGTGSAAPTKGVWAGIAPGGAVGVELSNGLSSQNFVISNNQAGRLTFDLAGTTTLLQINTSGDLIPTGNVSINDGKAIVAGTGTGMQIATSATQKIGFYGATPIVRRSAAASATDLTTAIALANALRDDLVALGLKTA